VVAVSIGDMSPFSLSRPPVVGAHRTSVSLNSGNAGRCLQQRRRDPEASSWNAEPASNDSAIGLGAAQQNTRVFPEDKYPP
jgi:hypothetical protein